MSVKNYVSHHILLIFFLGLSIIFATQALALEYAATLISPNETQLENEMVLSKVDYRDDNTHFIEFNSRLVETISSMNERVSVKVIDLQTNESIGIEEDESHRIASLYKVFAAAEVYRQIELGEIDRNQLLETAEGEQTVQECIRLSITASDNPCGRALRQLIGGDAATPEFIRQLYPSLDLTGDYPTANAKDVAELLKDIYAKEYFDGSELITHLENQLINSKLPRAIEGDRLAHKTGELEDVSHDAGILYEKDGEKIIVVLSSGWSNPFDDAPEFFEKVMRIYYETKN